MVRFLVLFKHVYKRYYVIYPRLYLGRQALATILHQRFMAKISCWVGFSSAHLASSFFPGAGESRGCNYQYIFPWWRQGEVTILQIHRGAIRLRWKCDGGGQNCLVLRFSHYWSQNCLVLRFSHQQSQKYIVACPCKVLEPTLSFRKVFALLEPKLSCCTSL